MRQTPRMWLALALAASLAACGGGEAAQRADGAPGGEAAASSRTEAGAAEGASAGPQEAGGAASAAKEERADRVRVLVGEVPVWVEVADDPAKRERGLMFRESLPEDEGMLFVYPTERELSFWMKNTPLALDIAFLDRHGVIVDMQQMEALSEETHVSRRPAMYALEMRLGWFADHGIAVGDRVRF